MTIKVIHGDSRDVLKTLQDASVDSVVSDPPYALVSIQKRFGKPGSAPAQEGRDGLYKRASSGFMGQQWDTGEVAFDPAFWVEVLRVLKPGGHLIAFGGTRSYHRLACAIEDAGFEIRDCLMWVYGSGFPKSHDVSKGIDRHNGDERPVVGRETLTNDIRGGALLDIAHGGVRASFERDITSAASAASAAWSGWGTALKPSQEPLVVARKPIPNAAEWATIGESILRLWSRLWLTLPASAAEKCSGLSPSAFGADPSASAQWSAADASNTQDALSGQMDTSQFVSATITSLSTVSSWSATLAEASGLGSTSITEMETSPTIDLRILKSFLSKITPESIIQAHRSGAWSNADAGPAERYLSASVATLSATLELSALVPAIERELHNCLDAGARPFLSPIVLARKPLIGTVAANVLQHGTGALNIDGCRVSFENDAPNPATNPLYRREAGYKLHTGNDENSTSWRLKKDRREQPAHSKGRWPANIIHDGSDEVIVAFPEAPGMQAAVRPDSGSGQKTNAVYGAFAANSDHVPRGDSGTAARFFYSAKADKEDRLGSKHPTVKPVDLMAYLCRLVTPQGGTVLDPFAGSGTTGMACMREGFNAILIEREARFVEDIKRRIAHVSGQDAPLFAEVAQ